MKRREFITLLGGAAAAWPLAARAQRSSKLWRVGFLAGGSRPSRIQIEQPTPDSIAACVSLATVEGIDFVIEWRFAEGRFALFPQLGRRACAAPRSTSSYSERALPFVLTQQTTSTIPIVMGYSHRPRRERLCGKSSAARWQYYRSFCRMKRRQSAWRSLLRWCLTLDASAFSVNPDNPSHAIVLKVARVAAEQGGLDLTPVEAKNPDEVDARLRHADPCERAGPCRAK